MSQVLKTLLFLSMCLFIVTHSISATSQNRNIQDSLRNIIQTASEESQKINALIELANTIGFSNVDSTIMLYNQAKNMAQKKIEETEYKNLKALALHKLGNLYLNLGNLDSAMVQYNQSAEIRRQTGDKEGLANVLNNIGIIYSYQGDIDKSLDFYNQALELRKEINNKAAIAGSLDNIGMLMVDLGEIDSAVNCYYTSLKIYEELKMDLHISRIYNNLGIIYKDKGDIANALDFYTKSLSIAEKIENDRQIANVLSNIGLIYNIQGDTDKALEYYNKSLKILREIGNSRQSAYVLQNIGSIYYNKGEKSFNQEEKKKADSLFEEALQYYKGSLITKEEIGDQFGLAAAYSSIGATYLEKSRIILSRKNEYLDDALSNLQKALEINHNIENKNGLAIAMNSYAKALQFKGEISKALDYALKSYKLSKELGNVESIKYATESLEQLYKLIGNENLAYKYFKEHIRMRDSLAKEEDLKLMQQKYYQYEYEKQAAADSVAHSNELQIKNLKIEKANEEVQKHSIIIAASIFGLMLVLALAIVMFRMFRQKKKANMLLREQNIQIQEQKSIIEIEKQKSDELLLNILPIATAEELKSLGKAIPRYYKSISVLFTDFKGFTKACAGLAPDQVVEELDMYFKAFDNIIENHGLEKIKTIGDAYMCAGGLPVENTQHPINIVKAALELQKFMQNLKEERIRLQKPYWELRVGIHTGEIIAGVVGRKKFAYDIWGNTVNIASRMESNGEPGKVNISQDTFNLVKDLFNCEHRGKIEAKNVGAIDMYFVNEN